MNFEESYPMLVKNGEMLWVSFEEGRSEHRPLLTHPSSCWTVLPSREKELDDALSDGIIGI